MEEITKSTVYGNYFDDYFSIIAILLLTNIMFEDNSDNANSVQLT